MRNRYTVTCIPAIRSQANVNWSTVSFSFRGIFHGIPSWHFPGTSEYFLYVHVLTFLGLSPSVTVRVGVEVPSSRFSLMFCRRLDRRITNSCQYLWLWCFMRKGSFCIQIKFNILLMFKVSAVTVSFLNLNSKEQSRDFIWSAIWCGYVIKIHTSVFTFGGRTCH